MYSSYVLYFVISMQICTWYFSENCQMNCVLFGEPRLARTASQCSHHCFWFCCLPRNIFQGELSFFTCIYIINQVHKHFFLPPFLTKLGERFSKPSPKDPFYTRSRTMLLKLARSREVREELQEKSFNRSYVAFAH